MSAAIAAVAPLLDEMANDNQQLIPFDASPAGGALFGPLGESASASWDLMKQSADLLVRDQGNRLGRMVAVKSLQRSGSLASADTSVRHAMVV